MEVAEAHALALRRPRPGHRVALEVVMGLLRSRADNQVADLDHELEAAISRMRQTPDRDPRRELLRTLIDELLDRRLQLQQDQVIRAHEGLISAR